MQGDSVPDKNACQYTSFTGENGSGCRLERGEILCYPKSPFPPPTGDDLQFLLSQKLTGIAHKAISLDPTTGSLSGFSGQDQDRLVDILRRFSRGVTDWLRLAFPSYAVHARPDRISFRPEEEATRRLRHTARNDLLHFDAFPNRPSGGDRLLRVFVNLHPTDARVWVTSQPFAAVLANYGDAVGLPDDDHGGWFDHLGWGILRVLQSGGRPRSAYDAFMLRFHDYLKSREEFQERARKRLWHFQPGSAWLAFTDGCSYGELRGQFALEHSYFIRREGLFLPEESPVVLLERFRQERQSRRAA